MADKPKKSKKFEGVSRLNKNDVLQNSQMIEAEIAAKVPENKKGLFTSIKRLLAQIGLVKKEVPEPITPTPPIGGTVYSPPPKATTPKTETGTKESTIEQKLKIARELVASTQAPLTAKPAAAKKAETITAEQLEKELKKEITSGKRTPERTPAPASEEEKPHRETPGAGD